MGYREALQKINRYSQNFENYKYDLQGNSIARALNFDPRVKMGLPMAGLGLKMAAIDAMKANPGDLLHGLAPELGTALLMSIPLRTATQNLQKERSFNELRAEEAILKNNPTSITVGDIVKTGSLGQEKLSKSIINNSMLMTAAGALSDIPALTTAGLYGYTAGNLMGGPLRAASSLAGLGHMISGHFGAEVAKNANPLTAGMAYMPTILGKTGSAVLHTGGFLAKGLGATSVGDMLYKGGEQLSTTGAGLTKSALADPTVAIVTGVLTMMIANPAINKLMEKVKSTASGQNLLKNSTKRRPQIKMSTTLERTYSKTLMMDSQVSMLGNTGQLKTGEWLTLTYLGAIEKSVSLIGFIAEYIQDKRTSEQYSSDMVQNNIQTKFSQEGVEGGDLSGGYNPTKAEVEIAAMPEGFAKKIAELKYGAMKRVMGASKWMEKAALFTDIPGLILGGKNSPYAKLKAMREEEEFLETAKEVSKETGLNLGGVIAMETSATELANQGETAADKTVSILSGLYELQRIQTGKVIDIADILGVTKEDSYLGKFAEVMEETRKAKNEREKGLIEEILQTVAETPLGPLLLGGAAAGAVGSAGAATGFLGLSWLGSLLSSLAPTAAATGAAGGIAGTIGLPLYQSGFKFPFFDKVKGADEKAGQKTYEEAIKDIDVEGMYQSGSMSHLGLSSYYLESIDTTTSKILQFLVDCLDCNKEIKDKYSLTPDEKQQLLEEEREKDEKESRIKVIYNSVFDLAKRGVKKSKGIFIDFSDNALKILKQMGKGIRGGGPDGGFSLLEFLGISKVGGWFKKFFVTIKDFIKKAGGLTAAFATLGSSISKFGGTFLGKSLGVGAAASIGWDIFTGDPSKENSWSGALAKGLMIGLSIPGGPVPKIAGSIVAIILSKYGPQIKEKVVSWYNKITGFFNGEKQPSEVKPHVVDKERQSITHKNRFKNKHPEWFHLLGDDGEFKTKNNRLVFIHENGKIYDVLSNKLINNDKIKVSNQHRELTQRELSKEYRKQFQKMHPELFSKMSGGTNILDQGYYDRTEQGLVFKTNTGDTYKVKTGNLLKSEKAQKFIEEKGKDIAKMGGDVDKIDTQEEVAALLKAIVNDQQAVGKLSIDQRNIMAEQLSQMAETYAQGTKVLVMQLRELIGEVKNSSSLATIKVEGNR